MAVYMIATIEVHDPERYKEYAALAGDSVAEHGGRYLVRGGATEVLEGDWSPRRVVVLEFPDRESLQAWYDSDVYREAKAIRQSASTGDFVVVEGV